MFDLIIGTAASSTVRHAPGARGLGIRGDALSLSASWPALRKRRLDAAGHAVLAT